MQKSEVRSQKFGTLLLAGVLCAWGAVVARAQEADHQAPPAAVAAAAPQAPPDIVQRSGNSLLRAGVAMTPPQQLPADSTPASAEQARVSAVSLMAVPPPQPKTLKKHDLIQIIIRESTQASSKGNTDAKKETSLDAHLDNYLKLTNQFQVKGVVPSTPLALTAAANTEFKGDATAEREDTYVTRIGAEVVDVKPNGTLLIQARKHIKLDEEEQDYILSGVCRVDDVAADNTILSTQLHDMDLTETTKGIVRDTNNRGFLTKLLAKLNPF
jgi:flagellar L-ring protein precursor FlgH